MRFVAQIEQFVILLVFYFSFSQKIGYFAGLKTLKNIVITVEQIDDEVIVRLPKFMNFEAMQRMIDLISLKEATSRSVATQEGIDLLAKEAKSGWWAKNRSKYVK